MSIPALQDCARELRRLAIAGSALARDDFRLKKIIPELQKTGAKVPVFARVASSLEELTGAGPAESAKALLQVTTLVNAVLYTQVRNGVDGELSPLDTYGLTFTSRLTAAKTIRSVIEALTTTGSGRLEVVKNAFESGSFEDLRLLKPALRSFSDPFPELAEFMGRKVLPLYGKAILPLVRADFNPKGGTADQRRLRVMAQLMEPEERRAFGLDLLENGSKEIRVAALEAVQSDPDCLPAILGCLKDRSQDVRQAAYTALGHQKSGISTDTLFEAILSKDSELAVEPLRQRLDKKAAQRLIGIADEWLARLLKGDAKAGVETYIRMLRVLSSDKSGAGADYFIRTYAQQKKIAAIKPPVKNDLSGKDIVRHLRRGLAESGDERAADALLQELDLKEPFDCLEACMRTKSPELVYDIFHPILSSEKTKKQVREEFVDRFIGWRGYGWHGYYYYYSDHDLDDEDEVPDSAFLTQWDSRWIQLATAAKQSLLVCALLRPDDSKALGYVDNLARNGANSEHLFPALQALSDAGYTDWLGLLLHRLRETKVSAKASGYSRDLLEVFLSMFPYKKLTDAELAQLDTEELKLPERHETLLREQVSQEKHRRATATRG